MFLCCFFKSFSNTSNCFWKTIDFF